MKFELFKMTLNVFCFLNAQLILLYCHVPLLRLEVVRLLACAFTMRSAWTAADFGAGEDSLAVLPVLFRKYLST